MSTSMIICAVGKGEMETSACLACALSGENSCGYDYSLLLKMLAPDDREGIHVSDIVGCLRKAYYANTQDCPEHVHHRLAAFIGKGVHSYLEDQVGDFSTERKVSGWGVVGTADVVYENGRLLDFKTVRKLDRYFLPRESHVRQLNVYAAMLEREGFPVTEMYVQYIDVAGPSKCPKCGLAVVPGGLGLMCPQCERSKVSYHTGVYLAPVPKETPETMEKFIRERHAELDASIALDCPPVGEPSAMCSYCKFMGLCPEKEVKEDGI